MGSQRDCRGGGWMPFRVLRGPHWRVPSTLSSSLALQRARLRPRFSPSPWPLLSLYTFTPTPPWSLASQPPAPSEQSPSVPPPLLSDHPRRWRNPGSPVPLLLIPHPHPLPPPPPDWTGPALHWKACRLEAQGSLRWAWEALLRGQLLVLLYRVNRAVPHLSNGTQ